MRKNITPSSSLQRADRARPLSRSLRSRKRLVCRRRSSLGPLPRLRMPAAPVRVLLQRRYPRQRRRRADRGGRGHSTSLRVLQWGLGAGVAVLRDGDTERGSHHQAERVSANVTFENLVCSCNSTFRSIAAIVAFRPSNRRFCRLRRSPLPRSRPRARVVRAIAGHSKHFISRTRQHTHLMLRHQTSKICPPSSSSAPSRTPTSTPHGTATAPSSRSPAPSSSASPTPTHTTAPVPTSGRCRGSCT